MSTTDLTETNVQGTPTLPPQKAAAEGPSWQEQDSILREMWMRNQPPAAIAEALGRSIPAIMTRAARLGLPRRFAPGRKPGRRSFETGDATNAARTQTARSAVSTSTGEAEGAMVNVSMRVCLMCLGKFQSMGRHNRICPTCKNSAEFESGSRLPDLDFPVADS